MSAEAVIYGYLSGYAPLTDAGAVGARIYPDVIAQGEPLPAVVYSKPETEDFTTLDGTLALTRNHFVVQAWAMTRAEAESILDLCVAALAAQNIPIDGRGSTFDEEVGLHAAALEFDYWA